MSDVEARLRDIELRLDAQEKAVSAIVVLTPLQIKTIQWVANAAAGIATLIGAAVAVSWFLDVIDKIKDRMP